MAAWVKGGAVETDAALDAAAALLGQARVPVFAGLCADAAALRAAYRLADTIGACLDPLAGPDLYAELGALGAKGAMTTTPAETFGRADTVLVLGNRPWDGGLVGELAGSRRTRGRAAGEERRVLCLGGPGNGTSRHVAYGVGNGGLAVALGHLRAFLRGNLDGAEAYADLARRLAAAKFGTVIYQAAELGELGVEMLQGLVMDLNETTRFFTLGLCDPFQGRMTMQLSAWTTGQGPRVGLGRHRPEHDPWRFDSVRQIREGEADAALWLAALPAPAPDWLGGVPSVALVGEGSPEARADTAQIVLTVAVPGETAGGALWHERRGVIAYEPGKRSAAEAATAADLLARLGARIERTSVRC